MAFDFVFFAALALALGFKHSFDVDHVVAVSSFLTRQPRMGRTLSLATTWAAGHMVTAALVSGLVFFFAESILPITSRFEILVPVMLLAIGLWGILTETRRLHFHRHAHTVAGAKHSHFHSHFRSAKHEHGAMAGVGVIHGLASNDELLIVLVAGLGATSWWQMLAGVGFFSLGVVAGMIVFASAVHLSSGPVTRRFGWNWVPSALTVTFSVASVAYAVYLLAGGDGVNLVQSWFAGRA